MRSILVSSLLLMGAPALAEECKHSADRSFEVDAAGLRTLATDLSYHDLRLRGVPGLARVEVRARACASNADDLARLILEHRRDGDRLLIDDGPDRGSFSFSLFGSHYAYMDIEVRLPASLAVEVDNGSGDVDARDLDSLRYEAGSGDLDVGNIAGRLVIDVGSGDVEGENIGSLDIQDVGSGDVTLSAIRGDAEIGEVGSGDVSLRSVEGSVRVGSVGSGDVDLRSINVNVSVDSIGSGDLVVDDVGGNLTVRSIGSGDVDHRNVRGKVDVPDDD
jgi:DUF4097 and DUF4098 domain-containing protein YvlB